MASESDPPRKVYGFKPTEFERANPARPQPEPTSSPDSTPAPPASGGRIDVRELNRLAATPGPVLRKSTAAARPNDVHQILGGNRQREHAAGLDELAPKPRRRSRRRRDYWMVLITANTLLALLSYRGWVLGGYAGVTVFVSSIAGIGLVTAGLTWVMFHVMDDY